MTDATMTEAISSARSPTPKLDQPINPLALILFFGFLAAALLFVAYSLYVDVDATGARITTYLPFLLLFVALVTALGFEFVNGFHDTANAVATVIYTHALPAPIAVVWSGLFNFLGVLLSSGAVAFGIVSLLPVELILQVGSSAGFAMVFALLIAAMIWNLGTWYFGLPASSSHTSDALRTTSFRASSRIAASRKPKSGDSRSAYPISVAFDQSTPEVPSRPRMSALAIPTPIIDPIKVCELDAGSPKYQVPRFQIIAAINSAKTMAKPALLPTCKISSTGSSETMPNATAPDDSRTPSRL